MKSIWQQLTGGSNAAAATPPATSALPPPPPGYPTTYQAAALADRSAGSARVRRPEVFDPALAHFRNGFRRGDPVFEDDALARRWLAARREAARHVLRLVARSPFAPGLVLRGSFLMRAWFGDAAREPHDLDWVVRPPDVGPRDRWADELFGVLPRLLAGDPYTATGAGGAGEVVVFDAGATAVDDIWTYDRVPGRRIVMPWRVAGLPGGAVQMDVVFGEHLPTPPEFRLLVGDPARGTADAVLWGAGMAQSLAWKLQWLATDHHPQGKDLYDAVLLAERARVPWAPLRALVAAADPEAARFLDPMSWQIEWEHFTLEYPWVEGSCEEWRARLARALAAPDERPESPPSN